MPWAWNEKVLAVEMGWGGKMGKEERGRGEAVTWLLQDQLSPVLFMRSEATMRQCWGLGAKGTTGRAVLRETGSPLMRSP